MSAAGNDQDRGAVGFFFGRQEYRDRRILNVADPIVPGEFRLITPAFEARSAVFPKVDYLRGGFAIAIADVR